LKTSKEQRLQKGVSFKEGSIPLDADDSAAIKKAKTELPNEIV
jgi:hypothetical protein